jgi:Cdc6-like AAA superfamily ATPase
MPHGQLGSPNKPFFTYTRFKNLLDALQFPQDNEENIIKSYLLYDYDKNTENYAKLNVNLKKRLITAETYSSVRLEKLKKYPDTPEYFWRRLNCLNAAAIRSLKKLNQASLSKFLLAKQFAIKHKNPNPQQKTAKRILRHLLTKNAVVLKGPPGTGKSFIAAQCVPKENLFFGEESIVNFLESKPTKDKPAVLLIDEANLQKPGTWEFLLPHISSLTSESCVRFKSQDYKLNENFKIIFTCNPESYPGRDYHAILQDTPTVYIKAWTDETLKAMVLLPLCKNVLHHDLSSAQLDALNALLKAYHLVESLMPPNTLSLRDIQEVTRRWLYLLKKEIPPLTAVHDAALSEWQLRFLDTEKRQQFLIKVSELFPDVDRKTTLEKPLKALPSDFYLSEKQRILFAQCQQDLQLFMAALDEKTVDGALSVKSGFLLEGPSGVGKSTLCRELLKSMSFK